MRRKEVSRDVSTGAMPAPAFAVLVVGLGTYLGWQTVGISPTLFPQPSRDSLQVMEPANYAHTALFLILLAVLARVARRAGGV
ncbi:hypothetical protein B5F40_07825, partial [Gordonibacter sp. An230]|uniref:hypothetical protein n=1 Tax=Gordonibacter sp. An230 TaxID=1965592 RepID=UPI000B56DEBA